MDAAIIVLNALNLVATTALAVAAWQTKSTWAEVVRALRDRRR